MSHPANVLLLARGPTRGSPWEQEWFVFRARAYTLRPLRASTPPRVGATAAFQATTGVPSPLRRSNPPNQTGVRETLKTFLLWNFSTAAVSYDLQRLFVGVGGSRYGVGTPGH